MGEESVLVEQKAVDTEVLFTKDNVFLYPGNKRILGRFSLVKQHCVCFLAWLPYKTCDSSFSAAYGLQPFPVSEVKLIKKCTKILGLHYILIQFKSGVCMPPLYFHSGGVRKLFSILKQHVALLQSSSDSQVYIINDISDPLQRSLAPVASDDIFLGAPEPGSQVVKRDETHHVETSYMEKAFEMSKIAYKTTSEFIQNFSETFSEERQLQTQNSADSNEESTSMENTRLGSFEIIEHSVYEMKRRPVPLPLSQEDWNACKDDEGRFTDLDSLKEKIFYGGVHPSIRPTVLKYLLGFLPYSCTTAERYKIIEEKKKKYKEIHHQWKSANEEQAKKLSKRKTQIEKDVVRTDAATMNKYNMEMMKRILIAYSLYNFDLGYCQGMSDLLSPILYTVQEETAAFWCFVGLMEKMEKNFDHDQQGMHSQLDAMKKLVQILDPQLHSHFENKECQNFLFCFRWLLIHFKREFHVEDTLRLWESFWSCTFSKHFHLFFCVAVLQRFRRRIIEEDMDFDSLIRFTNDLGSEIPLQDSLSNAEILCKFAGDSGQEILSSIAPVK